MEFVELDLHYHDRGNVARPWRAIPPGTWVTDSGFHVRRALDEHIYDLVIDDAGYIYFWKDYSGWYREGSRVDDLEEAKALAAVLLRLKGSTDDATEN